jgi:anion-transporting  ArsA/GET3 family ATPase
VIDGPHGAVGAGADTTLLYVMDVAAFCRQSRVLIVAGKGGVGKTTMTAALAHLAAQAGLSVLVVELEGRPGVANAFGSPVPLDYAGAVLKAAGASPMGDADEDSARPIPPGTVRARTITPDDALLEYLADHGLRRVSKRLMSSGIIDLVAGAIPGIRDVLVLGKVKQIERSRIADLILVDAPATGHTMTFLSSAGGLVDAARSGPIRAQAADVVDLLSDPSRCQVALVTLPEEMPVNEAVEAAYQLEDKVGIALGPVIVNGCYPPMAGLTTAAAQAADEAGVDLSPRMVAALDQARRFRLTRQELQDEQLERLAHDLPLPQLRAPFLFTAAIGPEELDTLSQALGAGVGLLHDPSGVSS